jgi:hypothetical protein
MPDTQETDNYGRRDTCLCQVSSFHVSLDLFRWVVLVDLFERIFLELLLLLTWETHFKRITLQVTDDAVKVVEKLVND